MPKQNLEDEQAYATFIEEIVRGMGLEEQDREMQGRLSQDLKMKLDEVIEQALVKALPDDKVDELDKLLDSEASDEEIEDFFDTVGGDYDTEAIIRKTLEDFRKAFVEKPEDAKSGEVAAEVAKTEDSAEKTEVADAKPDAARANAVAQAVAAMAQGSAQDFSTNNMTTTENKNVNEVKIPEGQPVQGAVSEAPGASNVEGVEIATVTEEVKADE